MRCRSLLCLVPFAFLLSSGCKTSPPANVAASVNDRAISFDDLEKAFRMQFSLPGDRAGDEQTLVQKLYLLRSLIDEEIMLQRAEKMGLMAVDTEVDAAFDEWKLRYGADDPQKELEAGGMKVADVKAELRRELTVKKLLNKEITSQIAVTDKEIADFYGANKAEFNWQEARIHLRRIKVTPTPDPVVRNLRGSKAQSEAQAKTKIQMIEALLKQGRDFALVAQNYSEDPESALNGGDLGFIPESALDSANPVLRKLVQGLRPGQISRPVRTSEGYWILEVLAKEPKGQRPLADPRVQQTIRETLLNRKDQLLKAAYYDMARNGARVVNYLAQTVADKKGKLK